MKTRPLPLSVKITTALITLIAAGWLVFGLLVLTNRITAIPTTQVRLGMGVIAIVCAAITSLAAYLLTRQNRLTYYLTVILLVMILIVSFMDEIGLVDALLIGVTCAALVLLVKDRKFYLGS